MSDAKRKVLACAMALVMAFSMVSVTSVTAFADQLAAGSLSAQAEGDPIVYDSVYGVFGGKYALMTKAFIYEAEYQYYYETEPSTHTFNMTVTDLVRSDGQVMAHTTNAFVETDAAPGGWTDYELKSFRGQGRDTNRGILPVKSHATGKEGVLSTNGDVIVPLAFDSVQECGGDSIVGLSYDGGTMAVSFFGFDGSDRGGFTLGECQDDYYAYVIYYGDYVGIYGYGSNGEAAVAHWNGEAFERVGDAVALRTGDSEGNVVLAKDDGNLHYCSGYGQDYTICPADSVGSVELMGSYIRARSGMQDVWYTTTGAAVDTSGKSLEVPLDGYAVFKEANGSYGLWSAAGDKVADLSSYDEVSAIRDSYYSSSGNYSLFQAKRSGNGSGSSSASGQVDVYKADGTFVMGLSGASGVYPVFAMDDNGNERIVGYGANGGYYDLDFNELAGKPTKTGKPLMLADGTIASESGTDANWKRITYKGYTLGGGVFSLSSAKHGNADLWWAQDSSERWGAINSEGEVVVPFEYESVRDSGFGNTDYALVKKDGEWSFLKVSSAVSDSQIVMHRLYNQWSGEHFYTSDEAEYANLVELGWTDEGEGWTAPTTSDTPVYRLYNPYAGEHHYTMDAAERDSMVEAGWTYEDIGWYSDDAKTVPLFREYNPFEFSNNHNYTTSKAEHDGLVAIGWLDEGYAWYGV